MLTTRVLGCTQLSTVLLAGCSGQSKIDDAADPSLVAGVRSTSGVRLFSPLVPFPALLHTGFAGETPDSHNTEGTPGAAVDVFLRPAGGHGTGRLGRGCGGGLQILSRPSDLQGGHWESINIVPHLSTGLVVVVCPRAAGRVNVHLTTSATVVASCASCTTSVTALASRVPDALRGCAYFLTRLWGRRFCNGREVAR